MKKPWLIAALVLGLTSTAAAQDRPAQPAEFESWRVPGWSFVPAITLGTIYDSNVALADAPAHLGRTDADQLMIVAPSGQLEYLGRRTEFSTGYRGHVRRYMDVDQLNSFDQRLSASFRRLVTRHVTFRLHNSFSDVPTTEEAEVNGVPFVRTGARTNSFAASVDARLTRYTDLTVRYENTWVDFDRKENFLTGGWVNGARTELRRRLTDQSSVGAEYGFRFADLNEGTRHMRFHDAGATFHHALGPHTSMSVAGGFSRLEDRLTGDTHTGPYVRTTLTHSAEHATVGAAFERHFVPSFGLGGSSQSQEVRGFVHMPIPRNRTYVQGSVAWRRSDPFVEETLRLDTLRIRAIVGYALARWLRTEGFYAYGRQDSEVTGGEIDRYRVGVQVVLSQPMRIR